MAMALPRPLDIAIQGERGAFSEEAARALLDWPLRIVATPDFAHMFSAVGRHRAHACLAPMENSLVGSIFQNYDLLLQYAYRVRGEVYLKVEHCLIAPVGTYFDEVRRVYSHPIALDQCQEFFRRHSKIETISSYDTAGSVQMLVDRRETAAAAVAGREAARHYNAKVLRAGIEDDPSNYTRFFLLSLVDAELEDLPSSFAPERTGPPKTSVVFHVENAPGSLCGALAAFAERGIDLTKIESRPVRGKPFEYMFYLDFQGTPGVAPVDAALAELQRRAGFLRILGSYPAGRLDWVGQQAPLLPRSAAPQSNRTESVKGRGREDPA